MIDDLPEATENIYSYICVSEPPISAQPAGGLSNNKLVRAHGIGPHHCRHTSAL